jgi:hypothetical protein
VVGDTAHSTLLIYADAGARRVGCAAITAAASAAAIAVVAAPEN